MKQYFEDIAWWDYLLFFVYNGIFCYLLYRIGDVFFNISKKTMRVFILIFQLYFIIIILDSLFNFLPYLPDTAMYSYMISSGQYPETSSENILVLYYFSLFIGLVCLNSPVIYTFFCVFLYILGLMVFLNAWKKVYPQFKQQDEFTFALLTLIWPAAALYMTAPLREAFVIFGFAVFLNGFLQFIYHQKWKALLIGSILICAIRLQLIVFVFPVIGILLVYKLRINNLYKIGILAVTFLIAILAVRYVLVEKPLSPETMAELRNVNISRTGELAYGNVEWHSYLDMARDYPFIIAQFLFSPLPIFVKNNPTDTFIPFLDVLFMIVLLLFIFSKLRYHIKTHLSVLLLALFYIILLGGYEYHLTGAVRHRMPLILIFILLSTPTIGNIFFKKKNNDKTEHTAVDNK